MRRQNDPLIHCGADGQCKRDMSQSEAGVFVDDEAKADVWQLSTKSGKSRSVS
jgi:hypothetical protein